MPLPDTHHACGINCNPYTYLQVHALLYAIPHAPPSYCVGRWQKQKKKKEKLSGSIWLFSLKFAYPRTASTLMPPQACRCQPDVGFEHLRRTKSGHSGGQANAGPVKRQAKCKGRSGTDGRMGGVRCAKSLLPAPRGCGYMYFHARFDLIHSAGTVPDCCCLAELCCVQFFLLALLGSSLSV